MLMRLGKYALIGGKSMFYTAQESLRGSNIQRTSQEFLLYPQMEKK